MKVLREAQTALSHLHAITSRDDLTAKVNAALIEMDSQLNDLGAKLASSIAAGEMLHRENRTLNETIAELRVPLWKRWWNVLTWRDL